jgi:hypothetical protein
VVRRLGEGVEERIIASGFSSEWSELQAFSTHQVAASLLLASAALHVEGCY